MLLAPAKAREVRAALGDLSDRFLSLRASSSDDPSLSSGHAGLALVHTALASVLPARKHEARAARALGRAGELLATRPLPPGLYQGFTGVAWVTELLQGDPGTPAEDDPLAAIDEALATYLDQEHGAWTEPYDLIQGVVGIGVYALERLPRPSARRLVALAVKRLADSARPRRPGVAWRSDPEWSPSEYRRTPHLEWNLGVAHGAPGAIALLGRVVAADVDAGTQRRARALLDKAVTWLLEQELPRGLSGRFGDAVGPGIEPRPSRTAWCYGDLGIAAALLVAARGAKQRSWERAARRIGLAAASRPAGESGVVDTGLCHGAAGVAHVFHRLFLATSEPRFADAARFWVARTLAMRGEHRGFAGFAAYAPDAKGKLAWVNDAGFLTGAAGVTLALVAAIAEDVDPVWDRVLLIS
jgi:hypothetical protein